MLLCPADRFMERLNGDEHRPIRVMSLELTRRCNLGCVHCFCGIPANHENRKLELSVVDWERILAQCADIGVLYLTVSGGEPLLRSDFCEIWKMAKKKGFLLTLFTNGTMIDDTMADFLEEWTPLEISISLYGASEETYYRVTGNRGMFQRVIDGCDRLARRNINLEVKGVFNQLNLSDYEDVKAIAQGYCELFRWDGELMGAFPECGNTPQDVRLSVDELMSLEQADTARVNDMKTKRDTWEPTQAIEDSPFHCGVGRGSAHIDAYGGMHPCLPLEGLAYDLLAGNVRHGWIHGIPDLLKNMNWLPGPCQSCDAVTLCHSCPAFALLENCSATGPVPFRCGLARSRAQIVDHVDSLKNVPPGF